MLFKYWANVADDGPTLKQDWFDANQLLKMCDVQFLKITSNFRHLKLEIASAILVLNELKNRNKQTIHQPQRVNMINNSVNIN